MEAIFVYARVEAKEHLDALFLGDLQVPRLVERRASDISLCSPLISRGNMLSLAGNMPFFQRIMLQGHEMKKEMKTQMGSLRSF